MQSVNSGPAHLSAISVERGTDGDERVAGEVLVAGAPAAIARARGSEFSVLEEEALPALGGALVRLSVPDGMHIEEAVATLRERAPDLLVTPNHVYHGAQASFTQSGVGGRSHAPRAAGVLGMIDTGVDLAMLDAPQAVLGQHAFAGAQTVGREHGSTVAALAIAHGMRVQVADVFANGSDGSLVASSASIAAALSWMIDNRIPVINISIEGPNNALLGELVRRATERGHVIVAAAGNGGPLARPAFPAAFDGSIAVTAIDAAGHPYRHANRGEYIAFAAPGVDINVTSGGHVIRVSGTSFAAPLIASEIAAQMSTPSPARARAVIAALEHRVVDLGEPGRDPIYGWGALPG